jgi:hypothetical protein
MAGQHDSVRRAVIFGMRDKSSFVFLSLLVMLLLCTPSLATAQRAAGETADIDPLFLVDTPIAGILPATSGSVEVTLYPEGGLLACFVYGVRKNLNVGISFGATQFIGSGHITWNNLPGLMIRYRFFEETPLFPAIVGGFDSQGHDGYILSDHQYAVKSPGFFVTFSKNYSSFFGPISFHGGVNYTLERHPIEFHDRDMSPNLYLGMEKTIGPIVSVIGEYNFAFDNDREAKGFWNGNLSLGVRIASKIGFNIDLLLKNLLTANPYYQNPVRELKIQYVRYL